MRVALRVEAAAVPGLRRGIPNLMRLFSAYQVRASLFFAPGRDLSGRRPMQAWRERRRLGVAAMTYGSLRPGPGLGDEDLRLMQVAAHDGHDTGAFPLLVDDARQAAVSSRAAGDTVVGSGDPDDPADDR